MENEHDCDLQLTINKQFGTKIINSIHFPWSAEYDFQPAYYPFDVLTKGHENDDEHQDEQIINDVLVEPLEQSATSEEPPLQDKPSQESKTSSDDLNDTDERARRYKIDFYSVSLMIPEKPRVVLGNPVKIDDLTVRVKARFRASIRVFGREYSTHKSTPWVTLCGRSAIVRLFADGAKIFGAVTLNDIDLVAKVKIFKWQYDCQLGLTKLMNKHLEKRSAFELLDLSAFQKALTEDSDRVSIERIEFDEASDQLLLKLFVSNADYGRCNE